MNFYQSIISKISTKQFTLEELKERCFPESGYRTPLPQTEQWREYPFLEDIKAMYNPNHYIGKNYNNIKELHISNIGNVKAIYNDGSEEELEKDELEPGYYRLKKFPGFGYIYRLVAETWLLKPEGKNIVHHIDNQGDNNSVNNLMWVSKEEHYKIHKC